MTRPDALEPSETLAAFSRRLGVARSTVTRAAQAGRLVLDAEGQVLIQPSLQRWHATAGGRADVAQRHQNARGRVIPLPAPQTAPSGPIYPQDGLPALRDAVAPDSEDATGEGADPTMAQLKADTLRWQNASLLLELDLRRGVRLLREPVRREAHSLGNALRAAVDRLIDQTAPRLAAASSAAERQRLLQRELASVRRMLKAEFARSLRRLQAPSASGARPSPQEPA